MPALGDWARRFTRGRPATKGDTVSKKKKKKNRKHDELLPAILRRHSPSPATSSPKTDRGRGSPSPQQPPSSLPAILGDSEFRLGLVNNSRPRLPTAGSVPPDVHSCSQTLAWSSYFRIHLPTPSHAPLLPAPAGRLRKSEAWRRKILPPPPLPSPPILSSAPRVSPKEKNLRSLGGMSGSQKSSLGEGGKLNPELLRK